MEPPLALLLRKESDNHVGDELNQKSNTPPTLNTNDSEESNEDESTVTITTTTPKTTPTPTRQVQKLIAPFPSRLQRKKDEAYIDKIRETFSQVKIDIPLLDAVQQMP